MFWQASSVPLDGDGEDRQIPSLVLQVLSKWARNRRKKVQIVANLKLRNDGPNGAKVWSYQPSTAPNHLLTVDENQMEVWLIQSLIDGWGSQKEF